MGLIFAVKGHIEQIAAAQKTQTRRARKPGDTLEFQTGRDQQQMTVSLATGRLKWETGRDYAVVPGRGKPGVWWRADTGETAERRPSMSMVARPDELQLWQSLRIQVLTLLPDDIREISAEDAAAEGGYTALQYRTVWESLIGHSCFVDADAGRVHWLEGKFSGKSQTYSEFVQWQDAQPDALYAAWRIGFEIVKNKEVANA